MISTVVYCHIQETRCSPLQKSNLCIFLPQPNGHVWVTESRCRTFRGILAKALTAIEIKVNFIFWSVFNFLARSLDLFIFYFLSFSFFPSWGCIMHRLHPSRGVRLPSTSVLNMALNNMIVRFKWCLGSGECGAHLHCYCSQVHCGPEW